MSTYSATASNVTVNSTANDILSITPASNVLIQVIEFTVAGMGTASSASQINLYAVTTVGATGSGAANIANFNPFAPAAGSTAFTGWTTQPVVGFILVPLAVNANGGIYRWVARPGEEITIINGVTTGGANVNKACSIRASVQNGASYTVSVVWNESPL
jgi:hypothetical protein